MNLSIGYILLLITYLPTTAGTGNVPPAPDYSDLTFWGAHPDKDDKSDLRPDSSLRYAGPEAKVDVFFIHPTTYFGCKKNGWWNASLQDEKLNKKTDKSAIKYQASVFNACARVYAPRYRQAHIKSYYTYKRGVAKRAFSVAYEDVRNAFKYYIQHENQGRPFIIAGHSQGTQHAKMLIREFIDGKPLQYKMVAAYLIGMPVLENEFMAIPHCQDADQNTCFVTWRSYKDGHVPKYHLPDNNVAVTNPLTWGTNGDYAPDSLNEGSILQNFDKLVPGFADAQIYNGLLWVSRTNEAWHPFFINRKDYHIADYNFFYMNIRENACLRIQSYLASH